MDGQLLAKNGRLSYGLQRLTKEDIDDKVNNLEGMVEKAKKVIEKEEKKLIGLVNEKKD